MATSISGQGGSVGFLGILLALVFFLYYKDSQEISKSSPILSSKRSLLQNDQSLNYYNDSSFILRRFDGTCSAGTPCTNGACCANSGYCGYGPEYCGDTCISNCDAHAECGKYAEEANATCPLNVCCSQYGFCGTVSDFCDPDTCQSNCVEHPDPPSGSETGQVLNRVIGYYEGWNARSACHQSLPSDLPVDALTHINFAFGYISPDSYKIVPMDSQTQTSLYSDTSSLKSRNAALKVFISVGGWSFSDNDTTTQPLFGEISADSTKRQTFADNVVHFMDEYGFDGIDIDWEYPGATDRGGSEEDTENMVKLFKTLRETFDNSQRDYGLTFTIPASYWYLKYFDVPGLLKYADWTNLMSYDIHGIWDKDNEIGSVVNPHTNLTEIQRAVELLWRVEVKPSQISLGFGFYGRSFTLADSSCTTPGCAFSNASLPGVCTGTGGYLAYYEIQNILDENPDIEPTWDKDAAVKYFTWDTNQWISYDDADTFAQKVDWANDLGLSGSLVWASDLDDYTFSAHSALLGRTVKSNEDVVSTVLEKKMTETASTLVNAHLDTDCFRFSDCVDLNMKDSSVWSCGKGYIYMGYDRSVCKSLGADMAQPICCKTETAPPSCQWRGGTGGAVYCNGQCHDGEVTLFKSGDGGWPHEDGSDETQCSHGYKYFCCEQPGYDDLLSDCYWTGCGDSCKTGEKDVAYSLTRDNKCNVFNAGVHYCCKDEPAPLDNCHWVGKGDCADNTCASTEITLMRDDVGDNGWTSCNWGRKKSLCCTPDYEITGFSCSASLCETDSDFSCDPDPYGSDSPDEDEAAEAAEDESLDARSISANELSLLNHFDKRAGGRRTFDVTIDYLGTLYIIVVAARGYPGSTHLYDTQTNPLAESPSDNVYRPRQGTCSGSGLDVTDRSDWTRDDVESSLDTDHNPDLQYSQALLQTAMTGMLPSGNQITTQIIPANQFNGVWRNAVLPNTLPRASASRYLRTPNDYFMDWFGSNTNRGNMVLLDRSTNQMKGRVFDDWSVAPQNIDVFRRNLNAAVEGGEDDDINALFKPFEEIFAIFNYINDGSMLPIIQAQRRNLLAASNNIANSVSQLSRFNAIHREFDYDWYQTRTNAARDWIADRIIDVVARYTQYNSDNNGDEAPEERRVYSLLSDYFDRLDEIKPPPEDPEDNGDDSDEGTDSGSS